MSTNRRWTPIADRVFARVDAGGDCWDWTGVRTRLGYGRMSFKVGDKILNAGAHRLVWALLVGPIPEGLTLDHRCRRACCVNPDHLEPVPHRTNLMRGIGPIPANARKTHCPRGHAYDEANTYHTGTGRQCRICQIAASRRHYARKKEAAA